MTKSASRQKTTSTARNLILGAGGLAAATVAAIVLGSGAAPAEEAVLYKNPNCGCCETYADYLRDNGFEVAVKPTHDLVSISRDAGIPEDFQGCHTMFIDDYVVSGHVPVETVERLLAERPDIEGVTLPGMPQGSPGMSGVKTGPFKVFTVNDGVSGVYATE